MKEASQYYFYHNDHLGTPQKLTAVNGAVVWSATYSSFGEATVEVEAVENPLRFPGQYFDEETGLHYNWYRYYDPNLGRYLRSDPAGIMRGTNHLYAYSRNNPLLFLDPLGLSCTLIYNNTSVVDYTEFETIVYGDWIYDNYSQFNIKCWCFFHRDKRRDIRIEMNLLVFKVYECTRIDSCGNEEKYNKLDTSYKAKIRNESEYAGREKRREGGTMYGANAGVDSGSGCDCSPMSPPPPGWYQGNKNSR